MPLEDRVEVRRVDADAVISDGDAAALAVPRALADAPLRLIMPDLLGLGLSDKPRDPSVHTIDGHAQLLRRQILFGPGDFFGEGALTGQSIRIGTATATTATIGPYGT